MLIIFLKSALFSLVFLFPVIIQPLRLGLLVIVISFFLSLLVGYIFISWFGFLLFLIYVGGLLVIFSYVIVLMPNNYFFSKNIFFYFFFSFFLFFVLVITTYYYSVVVNGYFNMQDSAFLLVSDYFCVMFLFLSLVLFYALLIVVKICYFHGGPLRPFSF